MQTEEPPDTFSLFPRLSLSLEGTVAQQGLFHSQCHRQTNSGLCPSAPSASWASFGMCVLLSTFPIFSGVRRLMG